MASPSNGYDSHVVHLKEQSLLKNAANSVEIGLYMATHCLFELCTRRQHSAPGLESDEQKKTKKTNTIFSHSSLARALTSLEYVLQQRHLLCYESEPIPYTLFLTLTLFPNPNPKPNPNLNPNPMQEHTVTLGLQLSVLPTHGGP